MTEYYIVKTRAGRCLAGRASSHCLTSWRAGRPSGEEQEAIYEGARVADRLRMPIQVFREGKFSRPDRLCYWPWSSVYISAEGDVVPCGVIGNPETLSFGNIVATSFDSIWNGSRYQAFRQAMSRGTLPTVCHGCFTCGGAA